MNSTENSWVRFLLLISVLGGVSCTIKKPVEQTPAPLESRISKSFFAEMDSEGKVIKYKSFLAGWAPEKSGSVSGMNLIRNFTNEAGHCNVEFRFEKDFLVALRINPSHPKDPDRWYPVLKIPIVKHYRDELEKDAFGRETNKRIHNTEKDHWSKRPYMELNLSGLKLIGADTDLFDYDLFDARMGSVDGIEDIEWESKQGFLGFTLKIHNTIDWTSYFGGHVLSAKFRFNFLAFQSDDTFVKTPYSQANSKYLNVLHIIGETVNGNKQILSAAHWDLRKQHTIYLNNFPQEFVSIAQESVELWNDAFEKTGNGRPFRTQVRKEKYNFDLRFPGITWISDKDYSSSAPLGVGLAAADVKNGNILWGGVTLWGGYLEEYINSYAGHATSSAGGGGTSSTKSSTNELQSFMVQFGLMEPERTFKVPKPAIPFGLAEVASLSQNREIISKRLTDKNNLLRDAETELSKAIGLEKEEQDRWIQKVFSDRSQKPYDPINDHLVTDPRTPHQKKPPDDLHALLQAIKVRLSGGGASNTHDALIDDMATQLYATQSKLSSVLAASGKNFKDGDFDFLQSLIGQPKYSDSLHHFPYFNLRQHREMSGKIATFSKSQIRDLITTNILRANENLSFDYDRTFEDSMDEWSFSLKKTGVNKLAALRAMIKDLILHELGHMLGMGHNFKENILPSAGSVPEVYLKGDKKRGIKSLAEMSQDGHKNYTTVMGYKNPHTDIITKYEDITTGPNDLLVIQYLYNQQFPVYPEQPDSKSDTDFKFSKLKADGLIPSRISIGGRNYRVAFFESCNDFDASMGFDPYCNRFDRGSDAVSLVKNYFEDHKSGIMSNLYAFTNTIKGGNFFGIEGRLWSKSFSTFARVRVFYDYMRQKYEKEFQRILNVGGAQRIQNLLDFSTGCKEVAASGSTHNPVLHEVFTDPKNQEFRDLCVASGEMFENFKFFLTLSGPDSTRIDHFDHYVAASLFGGDAQLDWSRVYGTWKEIARLPLKFTSLYSLTSPYPFQLYRRWLVPLFRYSRSDGNYLINTFYAKEFADAIASTVDSNLSFANNGLETRTKIGRAVLGLGFMLGFNYYSNDVLSIDQPFIKNIRDQAEFQYQLAYIEVERVGDDKKDYVKKFKATLNNLGFGGKGSESISDFFLFTEDRTIIMPPERSLIYPLTPIRWYSPRGGYYFVIRMNYSDQYHDRLSSHSVRQTLEGTYKKVMESCVEGQNRNGLRYFFNESVSDAVFPGFFFPPSITNTADKNLFYKSIDQVYTRYWSNEGGLLPEKPNPRSCEEALRGQGLLVLAASAINGLYISDLLDFIEK